ncbi:hypothetical protein [Clostridium baratii]|uniref:hypothetical protein n=1 Tax=Clostridium baratii TaxID=1561 RepID=UPI0030CA5E7F
MIAKFEYDSHKGIVKINGSEVRSITDLKIEKEEDERYPTVTLKLESDVVVEGTLLNEPIREVYCKKCNSRLGTFVGMYSVTCPDCSTYNADI